MSDQQQDSDATKMKKVVKLTLVPTDVEEENARRRNNLRVRIADAVAKDLLPFVYAMPPGEEVRITVDNYVIMVLSAEGLRNDEAWEIPF